MTNVQNVFQQAVAAYRRGDHVGAVRLCDTILREIGDQAEGQAEVLNLKAVALAEDGQMIPARDAILAALQVNKSGLGSEVRAMLLLHAARIASALDLFDEAFGFANEAAVLRPVDSGISYQRARLAFVLGDLNLANSFLQECLRHYPSFAEARMLLAQIAMESAQLVVAEECYRAIMAENPRHARALAGLAEIRRSQPDDEKIIPGLTAIHEAGPGEESEAGNFATATFALADAHARAADYPRAFQLYSNANQCLADENPFDIDTWQSGVERKLQQSSWQAPELAGSAGSHPLFIVGMPRSGSSLLERMLGAHSLIATGGERQAMTHIEWHIGSDVGAVSGESWAQMRALYREGMRADDKSLWVCDKANRNFERVDLIKQLFPNSRLIWIIRNPLDTILSCYFQDFQHGLAFSHSLDHLTRMYCGHWHLMNKWQAVFGDSILPVQYESLVNDPETVIRFVCDFLHLEYDAEMLHPQRQRKPVRTASALQVQEPINARSLGRWRHYQDELTDVSRRLREDHIIDDDGNALLPAGVL